MKTCKRFFSNRNMLFICCGLSLLHVGWSQSMNSQDAQKVASTAGLNCNGQVVLDVNFNNRNGGYTNYSDAMVKQDFAGGHVGSMKGFSSPNNKTMVGKGMLSALYPKGAQKIGAQNGSGFIFVRQFGDTEEATLTYKLKFDPGFEWAAGGKLPGLGGKDVSFDFPSLPYGCVAKSSVRTKNAFSARLMWRKNGKIVAYTYTPDREKNCGDDTPAGSIQAGKWYEITQYIKLNTAGKKDGIMRILVDGKVVLDKKDYLFRTNPKVKINYLVAHTYRGGKKGDSRFASSKDSRAYFDDFKVTANCPVMGGTVITPGVEMPYEDTAGLGIRTIEQAAVKTYADATSATTTDFTPIKTTTEKQFDARRTLNLTPALLNTATYIPKCNNFYRPIKKEFCRKKITYLNDALNTVNEVILSYKDHPTELNIGIAEQIEQKYWAIWNKIFEELKRVGFMADNQNTQQVILKN